MTLLWLPGYGTQESIIIKLNEYLLNPEHRDSRGQLTGKATWLMIILDLRGIILMT
jgi:hypothetical protein